MRQHQRGAQHLELGLLERLLRPLPRWVGGWVGVGIGTRVLVGAGGRWWAQMGGWAHAGGQVAGWLLIGAGISPAHLRTHICLPACTHLLLLLQAIPSL